MHRQLGTRQRAVRSAGALVLALAASLAACANVATDDDESASTFDAISRNDILTRGRSWLNERVPYSQSAWHRNQFGSYRQDCSGYVSMAWALSTSLSTRTLWTVSTQISSGELQAGDALLRNSGGVEHVALFVRWAQPGRPVVWEEYDYGHVAEERTWESLRGFTPIRHNGTTETAGTSCPNGQGRVVGEIEKKFLALGGCNSFLGAPITDEGPTISRGGRYNQFQHGSIYWTPQTGAHEVHGEIRSLWSNEFKWEAGPLGYPLTDEQTSPDNVGHFSVFEGGSIYWSPKTGAHEVRGAIRDKYKELGWETGDLGYPTSGEVSLPDGLRSDFEHGSITWTRSTDKVTVEMKDDKQANNDPGGNQ
jgi:hypothetical protein